MKEEELVILIHSFLDHTLGKSAWTHEAHIAVSFWFNWHYDYEEAFLNMKNGIITYNESVGTVNSTSSGYHETMTRYWMIKIHNFLANKRFKTISEALSEFIESPESHKHSHLEFYTKELLFSAEARQQWINGDKKELILEKAK